MRRIYIATLSIPTSWLVGGVLVVLFLLVAVIVIAVVIFLLMRRRSKAQPALRSAGGLASSPLAAAPAGGMPKSEAARPSPPAYTPTPAPTPSAPSPSQAPRIAPAVAGENAMTVDLSRTVAITQDGDTPISYGSIKFISGGLAGEQFELKPEGSCIGRDSTLSQIVIADPRISKRHVWIGVRDGQVMIVDQDSRNGTFVNDPKSPRVKEVALNPGDTVILGESDVARFEYQS
jgi:Inner membrane component of T3SS, cytoplasmic domain